MSIFAHGEGAAKLSLSSIGEPLTDNAASKLFNIKVSNVQYEGQKVTKVEIRGPDVTGLLACLASRISSLGCDIIGAENLDDVQQNLMQTSICDVFHVMSGGLPISEDDHPKLEKALRGTCAAVVGAAAKPRDKYHVILTPDEARKATAISVEGPDAPGLLNALTNTLSAAHCSIVTFSGETTDAGEVLDKFIVKGSDGQPISKAAEPSIISRLKEACGSLLADMTADGEHLSVSQHSMKKFGETYYKVSVTTKQAKGDKATKTRVRVVGPDVPGLLGQLTNALSADGYSIIGFTLGKSSGSPEEVENELTSSKDSLASSNGSKASSKHSDVHDVFEISRDGKSLDEAEGLYLSSWLQEKCEAALLAYQKAELVTNSVTNTNSPAAAQIVNDGSSTVSGDSTYRKGRSSRSFFQRLFGTKRESKFEGGAVATPAGTGGTGAARRPSGESPKQLTANEKKLLAASLGDESKVPAAVRRAKLDPMQIVIDELIGSGAVGQVLAGRYHGTPVAIKKLHRKMLSEEYLELFKEECELCLSLRHPNIVQLIGGCWQLDSPDVLMVMERCKCTLHDVLIATDTPLPMEQRLLIMVGIARAMSYLHAQSPPILHRDLKPENVLLMDDMQPKLSDFGSSREAAMLSSTMIGTPLFAAPEVLGRQKYGLPCDVWSYGCLVACIITRSQYPYPKELLLGVNFAALSASVTSGMLCPGLPPRQSSPVAAVGWMCCQLEPSRRATFIEVTDALQDDKVMLWAQESRIK